jgi:hypothetical protein
MERESIQKNNTKNVANFPTVKFDLIFLFAGFDSIDSGGELTVNSIDIC